MGRPTRKIDLEGVRRLAEYAGLPMTEDRLQTQLEFLQGQIETVQLWEQELRLGFWFEDGKFSFVRPAVIYRPPWEKPVPLNKNKAISKP